MGDRRTPRTDPLNLLQRTGRFSDQLRSRLLRDISLHDLSTLEPPHDYPRTFRDSP